ncbi:DNA polymerase III subunit gamma/tau, partial [Bordetella petrii]|nr:DNA polymerase III subunit gamma/tau [Bordetella petrii]
TAPAAPSGSAGAESPSAPAAEPPPWEDLPASPAAAAKPPAAALAVTPPATLTKTPPPDADPAGPPAWVDEDIPDDAQGGYAPASEFTADPDDEFETLATGVPAAELAPAPRPRPAPRRAGQAVARLDRMSAADWPDLAARLPVTGLASELARQSEWAGVQGDAVLLRVAVKTLAESESRVRLQTVLCEHFGQGLRLEIEVGATGDGTAHAVAQIERAARQRAAEEAVAVDPFVQALQADFGGRVVPGSVRAVESSA